MPCGLRPCKTATAFIDSALDAMVALPQAGATSSGRAVLLVCILLGAAALIPASRAHQRSDNTQAPSASQSQPVPAHLLVFGAALHERAAPELKNWVKGYVKKEFKQVPSDASPPGAAVAQRFLSASPEARTAVVFLLFYTGYHEEGENQKLLEARIHEIDHWIEDLQWRLPTRPDLAIETYGDRRRGLQVERLQRERKMKSAELETSRQRVNAYLNLLLAQYPSVKDTDSAVLASVK